MPVKDVLKVSRKTFFNPRAWLGYDSLKNQTHTLWSFYKDATRLPQPMRQPETFEEAMERQDLTEKDLGPIATRYFTYAVVFLGLAVVDIVYGIYLLFHHHAFLGLVLALAVSTLLFAQAFKYHFWYFQIKKRTLGCTIKEWRQGRIDAEHPPQHSSKKDS